MKYLLLLLLLLFTSSTFAQDTTQVSQELRTARNNLAQIESQISELQQQAQIIRDHVSDMESAYFRTQLGEKGGFPVRTNSDANLFSRSASAAGMTKYSNREAVITEVEGARVKIEGSDGRSGWIALNKFTFLEDPTEWADRLIASGDLKPISRVLLRSVVSDYRAALDDAELAIKQKRAANKAAADRQRILDTIERQGIPLVLNVFGFRVNSAGGVEPYFRFSSHSDKEMKYVTIESKVFNAVGDPAGNTIGILSSNNLTMRLVGPIAPRKINIRYDYENDPPFYSRVAHCIEIRSILIEFMDGTSFTMVNDLKAARMVQNEYNINGECQR